jgi:VWFA-related protein
MRSTASLLVIALATLAQNLAPSDEVRVSSRPYVPPSMVIHVDATLIQVGVVVRDPKGRAIADLKREDFRILDQGKEREISSFTVETAPERAAPLPAAPSAPAGTIRPATDSVPAPTPSARARFIALYFDDFGTPTVDLMRTKTAGKRFVEDGLSPADQTAVFSSSAGRLTEYTTDKARLVAAIEKIQAHPRFSETGSACPRMTPYEAYLIANHIDPNIIQIKLLEMRSCSTLPGCGTYSPGLGRALPANCRGAQELVMTLAEQTWGVAKIASQNTLEQLQATVADLSHRRGKRMMLLVSSGFLAGTLLRERDQLIDDALHSGVAINSLDAKGLFVEAPGRPFTEDPVVLPAPVVGWEAMSAVDAKETPTDILSDLAAATGGSFFHHNNDYSFGFRELGSVPDATYLLGFRPGETDADGKYHTLKVHFASNSGQGGYSIQARPGYYAPQKLPAKPVAPQPVSPRRRLDAQVNGTEPHADFPVKVTVQLGAKLPSGATRMDVQFHVDAASLQFLQVNDRHDQNLTVVAALFDSSGKIVTAKEGTMDLALKDAMFQKFLHDGVNLSLSLGAASGEYRLRAVVQESVDNKLAASTSAVQVP